MIGFIQLSCLLSFIIRNSCQIFRYFNILIYYKNIRHLFCYVSLNLGLSGVFSWSNSGCTLSACIPPKWFTQCNILGGIGCYNPITAVITDYLLKWCRPDFLTKRVLFYPLYLVFCCEILWDCKNLVTPQTFIHSFYYSLMIVA